MLKPATTALLLAMTTTATTTAMFAQSTFVNTLMPQPTEIHAASGDLSLTPDTTFHIDAPPSAPLEAAAQRMIVRLQNETGIQFHNALSSATDATTITIKVDGVARTMPALHDDESYRIDIADGHATIEAPTVFGAYHAFETLLQLPQARAGSFILPALHIADSPRFPWRGLMLDSGRHFLSVATVLRTIDGMAAVKLNVLHLHLSENQGFRIESHRYPKLTGLGSNGEFYTQPEMRSIIAYAAARGIRVVPEFDMPGHSTSWMIGYPELGSGPGPYKLERRFDIFDPTMDPTRESTYQFLDQFFAEMAQVFPDPYLHIGGDESNGKEWRSNPRIIAFMKSHNLKDTEALQTYFNKRVQAILKKYHRTMIGWDEVLHPDLSPDVVIQNWHGVEFLIDGAKQGHQGLLSQPWYLDHNYSAAKMFAADPIPDNAGLTPEQTHLILGGEACMWSEQIVDATIDAKVWPRAAAVAERLWSPQTDRNATDMVRRLRIESLRLDALSLQHLSGPQRALRQFAGAPTTPALDTLAVTLEPVDFGIRSHRQHNTVDTPMTGFVEALVFDPPFTEELPRMVDTYLNGVTSAEREEGRLQLDALFHAWIATGPALDQLASARPQLDTIADRRHQLVQLGELGLASLAAHDKHHPLSAAQKQQADELLSLAAEHSNSLADFVVLPSMETLVAAATQKP
jgi:hexosaminidase